MLSGLLVQLEPRHVFFSFFLLFIQDRTSQQEFLRCVATASDSETRLNHHSDSSVDRQCRLPSPFLGVVGGFGTRCPLRRDFTIGLEHVQLISLFTDSSSNPPLPQASPLGGWADPSFRTRGPHLDSLQLFPPLYSASRSALMWNIQMGIQEGWVSHFPPSRL